jgi:hypothetical protein
VVVGEAGLEPTTPGLEGRCSIQLSYSPVADIVSSAPPIRSYAERTSMIAGNAKVSASLQLCPALCALTPQPSTNHVTP